MNISTFYQHCRCEKISTMQHLLQEESRYPILEQAIKTALASLYAGVHPDTICTQMYLQLKDRYSKLEQTFPWKAAGDAKNDALKLGRFLKWFQESNIRKNAINYFIHEVLDKKLYLRTTFPQRKTDEKIKKIKSKTL